jgi:hypothetical protein
LAQVNDLLSKETHGGPGKGLLWVGVFRGMRFRGRMNLSGIKTRIANTLIKATLFHQQYLVEMLSA